MGGCLPRRTVDLAVDLPHPRRHGAPLLRRPRLDGLHAVHDARRLRAVLLQHLAQLLHDAPQVIHVRLLAAARQAVDHGDAILLGPAGAGHAVGGGGGGGGVGRGRRRGAWKGRLGPGVEEREVVHVKTKSCGLGFGFGLD